MSARLLDRLGEFRPASKFFDALTQADDAIRRAESAEWDATFAPPIRSYASCVCGSTFECRDNQIELTEAEITAAIDRLADSLGRAPHDSDRAIVIGVIDRINHERVSADWEAMAAWEDGHAYCEDYR